MHKIIVHVDRNGRGFRGMVDNKMLGKFLFTASSFEEMKEVASFSVADFIASKLEEGKELPLWMKEGEYSLTFFMSKVGLTPLQYSLKEVLGS